MLDKLVIHLKNVIFFKLVVYLISIGLLTVLIPKFQLQLTKAINRKEKAEVLFNQSTAQLSSIIEFEKNIFETNLKYKDLVLNSDKKICDNRTDFLKNLAFLSKKHNLQRPIKTNIIRIFEPESDHNKDKHVVLHKHKVTMNFSVKSYQDGLNLMSDIYSSLPKWSVVINAQIRKMPTLLPAIIELFSTKEIPPLIEVSTEILIREIVYEK